MLQYAIRYIKAKHKIKPTITINGNKIKPIVVEKKERRE